MVRATTLNFTTALQKPVGDGVETTSMFNTVYAIDPSHNGYI